MGRIHRGTSLGFNEQSTKIETKPWQGRQKVQFVFIKGASIAVAEAASQLRHLN